MTGLPAAAVGFLASVSAFHLRCTEQISCSWAVLALASLQKYCSTPPTRLSTSSLTWRGCRVKTSVTYSSDGSSSARAAAMPPKAPTLSARSRSAHIPPMPKQKRSDERHTPPMPKFTPKTRAWFSVILTEVGLRDRIACRCSGLPCKRVCVPFTLYRANFLLLGSAGSR